jgi:diguanylate cyclase (GGDEF)-like protein/PAS domain S-box-containing protein
MRIEASTQVAEELGGAELLDSLLEGLVVHRPDGSIVYANPAAERLLRTPRASILARGLGASEWQLLDVEGVPLPRQRWPAQRVLDGAAQLMGETVGHRARDGERAQWFTVNVVARQIGGQRHAVATFVELRSPLGFRFRDVVESSRDIVLVTDAATTAGGPKIVYANPAFSRLTGYSLEEVVGRSPALLQGPGTSEAARVEIREALRSGLPVRTTILNYAKSGRPYWLDLQISPLRDDDGRITHFAAIERDMSDTQEELEQALHAATHDPLTGALNRRGFLARAELMQAQARREGGINALLAIDIDHFKQINDHFGHAEGDRILAELAQLLRRRLRESDLFARLGGEEFAVLAPVPSLGTAVQLAESIRGVLRSTLQAGPERQPVTVSIGIWGSDGAEPLPVLLDEADQQLYRAKRAGRDRVAWRGMQEAAAPAPAVPETP